MPYVDFGLAMPIRFGYAGYGKSLPSGYPIDFDPSLNVFGK